MELINGILTGFYDLDYAIKGLNKPKLIILASRPAMGKSAFALNIAVNVAVDDKIPVAIFSLELSKEQCIERMITLKSEVAKSRNTNLNDEEMIKVKGTIEELSEANGFIDDSPAISINEIKAKCKKLKNEKNIGLIIIDYLQLIKDGKDKNICKELKNLSEELNVPILVTSQLSRRPEERFKKGENPRPILSDVNTSILKESDVIILLYREDYYNTDSENKDIAELIIAKNELGDTGIVKLLFQKEFFKFQNLEVNT